MAERQDRPKRRMIILSFDAVGARDLVHFKKLPNFSRLMQSGALCEEVESVYPSLTYPAHTTIVTGKKPLHHRVVNNTCLQPHRESPDWMYRCSRINGTTLHREAIKRGDSVCALLWPVSVGSKIRYHMPEIHATRWYQNTALGTLLGGSFGYLLRRLSYAKELVHGITEPELDDVVQRILLDIIANKNPELLLVHFLDVDTNRHKYGLDHPEVMRAFERLDKKLGEILNALETTRAGACQSMEDTTIVVLGDHCQMDCDTVLYPNYCLAQQGYLRTERGRIKEYQVVAKNADGACYLYPRRGQSEAEKKRLTQELTSFFTDKKCPISHGIREIYSGEEAAELGADDQCLMMLEAKKGFYFLDDVEVPVKAASEVTKHKMLATHGYRPNLPEYETFLLMSGYGVKKGARAGRIHLWDEAPTFARIMGIELPDADGRVVEELLS